MADVTRDNSSTVRGWITNKMTDKIVVLSTCGSAEEAERLARLLVEARLAACVSVIMQVRSFYRWKGKIEDTGEWLLIVKTSRGLFTEVSRLTGASHSYEVPEVLALPVADGSPAYLTWFGDQLAVAKDLNS